MRRSDWRFPYQADKLLEAARTKHTHHSSRLAWWEDKKKSVVETVRAEGIEIDESVANLVSNSYARGTTVQVRADLIRDVHECVEKIREHRGLVESYDAWMQVLASQGQSTFELNQDDWLFFFGK